MISCVAGVPRVRDALVLPPCGSGTLPRLRGAIHLDGFVKGSRPMRVNLVARGILTERRGDNQIKRNAEIGLFAKPS